MRVLILSALLAYAAAAPSVPLPLPLAAIPVVQAVVPTIPPGDVQAAAINAQVKADDQARAFADRARELAEQSVENQNEGVVEANDLAKEKSEEAFWNVEEKKWQALDALKTAEAQFDGAVASNAEAIARSAYLPYVASAAVVSGIPAPVVSGAYFAVPAVKAAEAQAADAPKAEETEAAVKAAEPIPSQEKPAEAVKSAEAEGSADSVQVESANLKASAPEPAKNENPFVVQSFSQTHPALYAAPLAVAGVAPAFAYSQPWVAPVAYVQPGLKAVATSSIQQVHGSLVAPAIVKAW